ncbi:MAG: LacI family transcriptional regulator [Propionibacteriaceae bacterium]|jgi:LacI family transcriptional regulator|nr:LacI family transcriptional regulator [Propionibacteriaceae bacterium]
MVRSQAVGANQSGPPRADSEPGPLVGPPAAVTIYDVAARVGVSISTVSHALNRPDRVSEQTRQRVLATADALGFRPRGRGKAARGESLVKRIAVVGPLSRHPSSIERLLGVLQRAEANLIDVVVLDRPADDALVLDSLRLRSRVDGVIMIGVEPSEAICQHLLDRRISTVLVDRASSRFSSVTVDDEAGGRMVAEHLLSLGCRRTTFVSPPPSQNALVTSGELRLRGFAQTLRQAGVADEVSWAVAEESFEGGREAARQLAQGSLPDAIFGLHDQVAGGVAVGLRELGLRLPQDVRLVGYDDIEIAALTDLTTVRQPFRQSGAVALDTLRTQILDPERPTVRVTLDPQLVVRGSTVGPDHPTNQPGEE